MAVKIGQDIWNGFSTFGPGFMKFEKKFKKIEHDIYLTNQ